MKEHKKKILGKEKGITLIALVITIIVLLILAGVSISMLTGSNGILTQAQNASKQTDIGNEKEQIALAYNGAVTEKQSTDIEAKDLNDQFEANGVDNATAEDGENGVITVTFREEDGTTRTYTIDENGKISEPGSSQAPGGTTESVEPGEIVETTEKNNYTDAEGNKATVPEGFVVSKIPEEQKISSGLVIYDIPENELESVDWEAKNEDGAYNVQTKYNQFVWIPVAEGEYERDFSYPSYYDEQFSNNTPEGSTFTDTGYLPEGITVTTDDAEGYETAEREAVMKYNGFYIGRYEAGVDGTTVISKQNATIYTNKAQIEFKEIAKTMYTGNNVKSAMSSGIQWDMVMKFVDGKNDGAEKTFNVRTYDKTRHTGSKTEAGKNINDKVQNIYDLEGNCYEYVAEKNKTSYPVVYRGGKYREDSYNGASKRTSIDDYARNDWAFRLVLYIM